ncbi:MAG: VWA domain-containing protein [Planctomycetota bacterium]|nr:VWA domain-containing protein [Planctomycetota bacterium]
MAVTTYCQSCCRLLRVPDDSVGQSARCLCGNSFIVEKPLAQRLEEDRQRQYLLRGLALLSRFDRKGIGRPIFRRKVFGSALLSSIIGISMIAWVEHGLFPPPQPTRSPIRIRLMLAHPEPQVADTGTSLQDPDRPPRPPGRGEPDDAPGIDPERFSKDLATATSKESPDDNDGSEERGRWRFVPEEVKKLWDLEGLDDTPLEGKTDPKEHVGIGTPVEGAKTRPNDEREPERTKKVGRLGASPERAALEKIARESKGGGLRFFGSPLPLEGEGVIFVIDRSASMILRVAPPVDAPMTRASWTKLELAKWELKKAIAMLPVTKKFNVIFFDDCLQRWRFQLQLAKPVNKKEAYDWLDTIQAKGQSNVSEAVTVAFEEKGKNTIILLTDGRPNVIDCRSMAEAPSPIHKEKIRQSNRENERIWCFGFSEDVDSEKFLQLVAEESGGKYTALSAKPF